MDNREKNIIIKKRKMTGERWQWKRENYLKRKVRRSLKRKRKKKKGKSPGKMLSSIPVKPQKYEQIDPPSNFSLVNNPEEVIYYFKQNGKYLASRRQVDFNLNDIEKLTPDAMALLAAKVKDERFTHRLYVKGKGPAKEELKRIFNDSRFLDHVRSGVLLGSNDKNVLIHKVTANKVENEIAREIGEKAVQNTFGKAIKFPPLYVIIIECMANTNNHAGLDNQGMYNWWILVYCNPKTRITYFSFLDLGVGVFNSNPMKDYRTKILQKIKDVTDIDLIKTNTEYVNDLFAGKIFSRTHKKERGKGLPLIYNNSKNDNIKNFTIISNDVYVKIPSLERKALKNKFQGTFLYWELHPNKYF